MEYKSIPSKQGDLDSLCGFYSITNMMYWLYGNKIRRTALFKSLLECYNKQWHLLECLINGIDNSQMDILMSYLAKDKYKNCPVTISQPFRMQNSLTKTKILRTFQEFLDGNDNRAILMCDQQHWSVVVHVDAKHLYFFDSGSYKKKSRDKYSLRSEDGKLWLYPDAIYFVERG